MPEQISLTIILKDKTKHKHVTTVQQMDYARNILQAYRYALGEALSQEDFDIIYSEKLFKE